MKRGCVIYRCKDSLIMKYGWQNVYGKRSVIVKRGQSTWKDFFLCHFPKQWGCSVAVSYIPKKCYWKDVKMQNCAYYSKHNNKCPEPCMKGVLFLHDNAQANKSKLVPEFLSKEVLKSLILLTLQIFPMSHLSLPKT